MRLSETDSAGTQPTRPPQKRESRSSQFTELWQRFALSLMVFAARPIQAMSLSAAYRFGTSFGRFAHFVATRQRKRAEANLRLAYQDTLTPKERAILTRRVFEHYGRCVIEFLRSPTMSRAELDARVTCEGFEHIEQARAAGRGVIFVSGHIGNWEILGRWGALIRDLPLTVVAKDTKNPALAAYLRKMREGSGFGVLSMGESARSLLKVLRRGEIICLLADQNSGDMFVPFFGIPTGTAFGPASLALHSGAVLLPIYCLSTKEGNFHIRCFPPVSAIPTNDREADQRRITTELNQRLEAVVREYPDQWLWLHNRWKAAFDAGNRARAWGDSEESEAAYQKAYSWWRS